MKKRKWYQREYALYKGETYICDGTIIEIAKFTGRTIDAVRYMTYPAYERKCQKTANLNRMMMVPLDE